MKMEYTPVGYRILRGRKWWHVHEVGLTQLPGMKRQSLYKRWLCRPGSKMSFQPIFEPNPVDVALLSSFSATWVEEQANKKRPVCPRCYERFEEINARPE